MISPKGSMKGYAFTVWLLRNKNELKNLLMGISALATYFATGDISEWIKIILTIFIPGLVKLTLDAIDFKTSNVQL